MTTQILLDHHRLCDELFASAEEAAAELRWADCQAQFSRFREELDGHFRTEEEVLFESFESASGMVAGPTEVMRYEHAQMRALLTSLAADLAAGDADGFAGTAETLLVMMQQHNLKEERILYPMCDRALAGAMPSLGDELRQRAVRPACRG
jgi:iron-sulfur cluster repair protein YtfE (RIC family)